MTPHRRLLSGPLFLPETRAWAAAANAAGAGVSVARLRLLNTLIGTLKAGGVWDALDRLWIFAAENGAAALIDLVARAPASAVNSPGFTVDRGYTGNGTSSYLDTNLNATAGGNKYARDSACFGGWIVTAPGNTGGVDFGNDYGGYSMLIARYNAGLVRCEVNAGTNPSATPAIPSHVGWMHADRDGAASTTLYLNGVSVLSSNAPSVALANKKFGVGAQVSGPSNFSSAQYGSAHIGRSLGAAGQAVLYGALRTHMTAIGVA